MNAIEKNQTWDIVDIPAEKTSIGVKWVYKTKLNEKGELEKQKAKLVSKDIHRSMACIMMKPFLL